MQEVFIEVSKAVFAICDSESMYIYNLMEYVHSRTGEEFEVQAFTVVESLCACAKDKTIEILLISGKLLCEQVRELQIRKVMVLSEGEQICELSEYSAVYKYQPADSLIAEVMDSYARVKEAPAAALFKPEVEVTGIYSPVKRTGKTSFALTLGQLLASTKAVLYLNLEEYAGFDVLMNRQFDGDISDLMYFSGSGKGNLISKLGGLVQTINNLDYIPPAFSPFDLRSIKCSEWLGLIEDLCSYSSYEVILLDFGEQVDNLPELLNRCGKIYMPVREDSMAVTKIAQYEKVMVAREYEEVLGKTIKLKLPFHSSFGKKEHYVEQLIWSELGDYVRQLIRKESGLCIVEGMEQKQEKLYALLNEKLDHTEEISDEEILVEIDKLIWEEAKGQYMPLSEKITLRQQLFNGIRRLDILQELLEDESVTEIMVNGTDGIFVEREGRIRCWEHRFVSKTKLEDVVQQIAGKCNRIVNEAIPITDARLENGDRVNIVLPPVAVNGPIITIRRFPKEPITMERLIELGSVSKEVADFLKQLVCAGYNIFICGVTGSGKTTFLNALSDYIPKDERIITIEDNAELQIQGVENLVRLEARKENTEGKHAVTIRDLIKSSLRMRPSRIIVGEVRGDEVVDMLQAMNTGMDGSLSTGHGNSPSDMLVRLETMVLMGLEMPLSAVRRQIASGIDILIHLGRLRDKSRRVLEIREITGYDYESGEIVTSVLYEFLEDGKQKEGRVVGKLHKKEELFHVQKLIRAGIVCQVHGRLT